MEVPLLEAEREKPDFQYLYFRSSCTFFQIGQPTKFKPSNMGLELPSCYNLVDSDSKIVGWVQLHVDNTGFSTVHGKHEFVIVSENQKYGDGEKDRELEKEWDVFKLYNVLLIAWKDKVADRLGLGRVWKDDWLAAEHELKVITLG
jgi:hypothetical protein